MNDGVDRLRVAAGIEVEDSFEAGSKWCVGDKELIALVALARKDEREACIRALVVLMIEAIEGNYSGQEEAVRECILALQERSNADAANANPGKEKE